PGYPLVGVEIDIVDEQGKKLSHDGKSTGEILARSDGVMKCYWNRPGESAAALQDGWLHTGDVGSIDEEGCLRIVDRKKDIIISGGENIASLEIEQRLYRHEAVLECAVIGVSDPRWGEVPKAFVVLRQGCSVSEQELLAFCAQTLPSFKRPASIVFLDALPKGGTGKILKRELRRSSAG
ncbi:MAG: AMP-binding protein, partial [Acidobacteria bacterium]|nr:AMP-binding protein [Acidobacteriota bacterium]